MFVQDLDVISDGFVERTNFMHSHEGNVPSGEGARGASGMLVALEDRLECLAPSAAILLATYALKIAVRAALW